MKLTMSYLKQTIKEAIEGEEDWKTAPTPPQHATEFERGAEAFSYYGKKRSVSDIQSMHLHKIALSELVELYNSDGPLSRQSLDAAQDSNSSVELVKGTYINVKNIIKNVYKSARNQIDMKLPGRHRGGTTTDMLSWQPYQNQNTYMGSVPPLGRDHSQAYGYSDYNVEDFKEGVYPALQAYPIDEEGNVFKRTRDPDNAILLSFERDHPELFRPKMKYIPEIVESVRSDLRYLRDALNVASQDLEQVMKHIVTTESNWPISQPRLRSSERTKELEARVEAAIGGIPEWRKPVNRRTLHLKKFGEYDPEEAEAPTATEKELASIRQAQWQRSKKKFSEKEPPETMGENKTKITKSQLKQIIKEELENIIKEGSLETVTTSVCAKDVGDVEEITDLYIPPYMGRVLIVPPGQCGTVAMTSEQWALTPENEPVSFRTGEGDPKLINKKYLRKTGP